MFGRHSAFGLLIKGCCCFADSLSICRRSGMPCRQPRCMNALHAQRRFFSRQRGSGARFSPEAALLPTLTSSTDHPVRHVDAWSTQFAKRRHKRSISATPDEEWGIRDDASYTTRDDNEAEHSYNRTQKIGIAPAPNVHSLGENTQGYIDFPSRSNKFESVTPESCQAKERLAVMENASIHEGLNESLSVLSNVEDHFASPKAQKSNRTAKTGPLHSSSPQQSHHFKGVALNNSLRCRYHWTVAAVDGSRNSKPFSRRISSKGESMMLYD